MSAAGNKGKVASKYKDKGLRVIAIDIENSQKDESVKKWKKAGAGFWLYNRDENCFKPYYQSAGGYPYNLAIKAGTEREINWSIAEQELKKVFGFL